MAPNTGRLLCQVLLVFHECEFHLGEHWVHTLLHPQPALRWFLAKHGIHWSHPIYSVFILSAQD